MKGKFIKVLVLTLLVCAFNSCDHSTSESLQSTFDSSSNSTTSESSFNKDVIKTDGYSWPFEEENTYKEQLNFSVSSLEEFRDLRLKIDGQEIQKKEKVNYDAVIMYDINPEYPVHSDYVEANFNEIKFNDESLGALPSDDQKGVPISVKQMCEGFNVFSATIGLSYRPNVVYDKNKVHGGLNGGGDDYQIKNMRLILKDGTVVEPTKMVFYKPKAVDSKEYVTYDIIPEKDKYYWIGDGWGQYLSVDKHPNPRFDIPFQIDFYFEVYTPGSISTFDIDTKQYQDGFHTITLFDQDGIVLQNNVCFDNQKPIIKTNINNYSFIHKKYDLCWEIEDIQSGVIDSLIKIDGKVQSANHISLKDLNYGQHNLSIYAKDKAGNEAFLSQNFVLENGVDTIKVLNENDEFSFKKDYSSSMSLDIYKANQLNVNSDVSYNQKQSLLPTQKIPCDEFEIDVSNIKEDVYISYDGETIEGERLLIEAFNNKTNSYEKVKIISSSNGINFKISPANYVINQKMKIRVSPLYFGNGSNRILWSSDTQYLPKVEFTDINYMYKSLMEYISDEYKNQRMSYLVHTGDIVDNNPAYLQKAEAEWRNATTAFQILDDNHVPYGVCAGNHDVGTALNAINYVYFSQYFGMTRYNKNDYYGGSLNNNECHFDLISIGNYDFIVLYIGFGVEATKETINWANQVLKTYSHRNAIIATHAYLDENGNLDKKVQAQQIYDEIVVKNDNVKFVFCGHTDGNAVVKKQINNQRYVYEILNCYQFVEKKSYSVSHLINGYKCNGEGFIKELIFENNKVKCHTYSPITNQVEPLGGDDFEIDVDLYQNARELTSYSFKAYQILNEKVYSKKDILENEKIPTLNDGHYIVYVSDSTEGFGFKLI